MFAFRRNSWLLMYLGLFHCQITCGFAWYNNVSRTELSDSLKKMSYPVNEEATLQVPLGKGGSIFLFADEMPVECDDLIDALRSELAPFRVWKQCAVRFCILFDIIWHMCYDYKICFAFS